MDKLRRSLQLITHNKELDRLSVSGRVRDSKQVERGIVKITREGDTRLLIHLESRGKPQTERGTPTQDHPKL